MIARKLALVRTLARLGSHRLRLVYIHRKRLKSGYYERVQPIHDWVEVDGQGRSPFQIPPDYVATKQLVADADRIVAGELRYFSWKWLSKPVTWRANPFNGFESALDHWSKLKAFDPQQGDIKWIWEPSRFDWAVNLARAYAGTGDDRYRARFTELLKDWRANNRPNEGVNWYCAQECSLRMLALVFAAAAFPHPPTPSPRHDGIRGEGETASLIWSTVAELAARAEPTIGYAIGQHNNHGTSEAMGLYLAGSTLPKHPYAARWRETGKRVLCQLIREQFASDGSYVQHSFVYQRLAMRACLICFLTARKTEDSFPSDVEALVLQSARFLRDLMISEDTGRLPNYGANDGANALSLSDCEYLDFRPIIQLTFGLLAGERAFAPGPWDEELAWFGVENLPTDPLPFAQDGVFRADVGGYYALRSSGRSELGSEIGSHPSPPAPLPWDGRGEESPESPANPLSTIHNQAYAFMRIPNYTDGRPGQADALHVDVWFDGQPVAVDSGTYSYNDPDGWYKHFKSTAAHNTVVVDGKDQMPLASRFLYTHWTATEMLASKDNGLRGVSHAYEQIGLGVRHEREARISPDAVYVVDRLAGNQSREIELRWHLVGDWTLTRSGATDGKTTLEVISVDLIKRYLVKGEAPQDRASEAYGASQVVTVFVASCVLTDQTAIGSLFTSKGYNGSFDDQINADRLRTSF